MVGAHLSVTCTFSLHKLAEQLLPILLRGEVCFEFRTWELVFPARGGTTEAIYFESLNEEPPTHGTMCLNGTCGLCILGNPYYVLRGHEPDGLILLYILFVTYPVVVVYELSWLPGWQWDPSVASCRYSGVIEHPSHFLTVVTPLRIISSSRFLSSFKVLRCSFFMLSLGSRVLLEIPHTE